MSPDISLIYHNTNDVSGAQMVDGFKSDCTHVRVQRSWEFTWVHFLPDLTVSWIYKYFWRVLISRFGKTNSVMSQNSKLPFESSEAFDIARVRIFKRHIRSMVAIAQANSILPIIVRWECDWNYGWVPPYFVGSSDETLSRKYYRYVKANNSALEELAVERGTVY